MGASFEEKSVWIQLIGTVVALGAYFVVAGLMFSAGVTALPAYVPLFIVAIVLLVILLAAGHALAAITGRPEGRDERDRLSTWRAECNSGWLLGAGVIVAVVALIMSVSTVWIAHLLLLSMLASEALGNILRIVYYRRGV